MYLFDEFDALGSQRSAGGDVGEIRRVLNSFLQFLELDDSDSLIIGATNHVDLLDQALFRRFDAVFEYGLPSSPVAADVMMARLALLDTSSVDWDPRPHHLRPAGDVAARLAALVLVCHGRRTEGVDAHADHGPGRLCKNLGVYFL